ncbi:MAG: FkbM family methyltransferase [Selenomonadaceae bacterium]|nr:FkbM family methyltransferase [Selenomonadaceae bacterium]
MLKLVLWDYTGESESFVKNFLRPNSAQIVRTLKPDDTDQAEIILRGDWDYVLIFADENSQEIFDEILSTMRAMNCSTDKIIFANLPKDWARKPEALYSLLKPSTAQSELICRHLNFVNHKKWHRYVACDAENLHYVGTSKDEFVIKSTYIKRENFAADEMKTFHALAKKFYGTDDGDGYFLDLGANIGTTGIYFLKKLAPNLKLFAVEPDAENFKLLRVNLILNDLDSRATLINCGLGENFDTLTFYKDLNNPGANSIFLQFKHEVPTETIKIAPLDYLLAESKIAPEEVKYIWIDTEGFEAQVLLGAKNLLAKSNAPVFMEFNPVSWKNSGSLEKMVDMLKNLGYGHFISVQEFLRTGEEKICPIKNLSVAVNYVMPGVGKNGDIFLIKNL